MHRLRSGLKFSRQQHQGKNYVVVKDPETSRYFRFTESQAAILELLREPIDAETLARRASIPVATIEAFLNSLNEKSLLAGSDVRDTKSVPLGRGTAAEGGRGSKTSLLYWKAFSINPEKLFAWLEPRTRWAFTPFAQLLFSLIIFTGLVLNYLHLDRLTTSVTALFTLYGLLFLWFVVLAVSTLHECAHGLTCTHYGGKVREMGFMLIYFNPALYCDVSDAWMFPKKKHRILVTFAGGYFQLVIWGIATIVWRVTETDTFINQIALVVNVFAGLQTLINFNPLIKLDGYYMLSDYLEIPNLRDKSFSTLWSYVAAPSSSSPSSSSSSSVAAVYDRRQWWLDNRSKILYGTASILFSTTLLIYVYSALYTWATSRFRFAGLVAFVMFSTFTLRRTASESLAGLRAIGSRVAFHKYRNAGIAAFAVLVSFAGYWELKIPADFRVIARNEMAVRPETGGVIVEMLVTEGTKVAKGYVLARLRDFDKQQRISELIGLRDAKRSELSRLRAGARPEEIDRAVKLVETKQVELDNVRRNQEQKNQLEQVLEREKAELKQEQQNLKRQQDLFAAGGLIPRTDVEKAETAVNVRLRKIGETEASIRMISEIADRDEALKRRELESAQSELRLMRAGNRPEFIRQAEAEALKLEQQVEILNQELDKTDVRSPIDGVVATPFVERKRGQTLKPGDELCRIVDISSVTIEMQVPEKEMADVRLGNVVWMKPRSFPSLDLQGRVDFIAPVAQDVQGQRTVVVRSELPNADLQLKPEMTGVAWIYGGQRRIADLMTRRLRRWVRTEFLYLLP